MKNFNLLFLNLILIWNLSGQQIWPPEEDVLGYTFYDVQSIRTMQNRIFVFQDGTIGCVWNSEFDIPPLSDMGIGYNYFDGVSWGMYPYQSIISGLPINPSYTDYHENGEILACQDPGGLIFASRLNKGTGNWQQIIFPGTGFKHPSIITTGPNNNIIHLLYLVPDNGATPTNAQPSRGFIWYARSTDGGITWSVNQLAPGLGPDQYVGFTTGSYIWADPKDDDILAFIAGDYLTDLVLMKTLDGGDTWQKTVIWEHPYPFMEIFSFDSDTFYCNDGGITVALDNQSTAHVAFGISRVYSSTTQDTIWYYPEVGSIAYWREGMATFSNNMNALNPYGEPYSELILDYNLVGYFQDGTGQIDTLEPAGTYFTPGGLTMPQLFCTSTDRLILVYSGITEIFNNGLLAYRHLWCRTGFNNGTIWGAFVDLNSDLVHVFDECVYPSIAANEYDGIHMVYQTDNEPGLCGEPVPWYWCDNHINHMKFEIDYPPVYLTPSFYAPSNPIEEGDSILFYNLSTGYPNPNYFEWTFEGGTLATSFLENPVIVYNEAGSYDVTLLVSNGVVNQTLTKENYITVLTGTGVNDSFEKIDILISPNPTNGKISVLLPGHNEASIKVFNLLGKVILESHLEPVQKKINLDLTGNSEGIYFVEIKSGDQNCIKKIILRK